mgnify:CR=1 FL=1
MRMTKAKALEIMRRVEGEHCFFNNDGKVFCGFADLAQEITVMPQPVFNFHCNSKKCDFTNWISDVLGDEKLAKDMSAAKGIRSKIENLILKRVSQLEKYL